MSIFSQFLTAIIHFGPISLIIINYGKRYQALHGVAECAIFPENLAMDPMSSLLSLVKPGSPYMFKAWSLIKSATFHCYWRKFRFQSAIRKSLFFELLKVAKFFSPCQRRHIEHLHSSRYLHKLWYHNMFTNDLSIFTGKSLIIPKKGKDRRKSLVRRLYWPHVLQRLPICNEFHGPLIIRYLYLIISDIYNYINVIEYI